MKCIIETLLEKHKDHLRKKNTTVIARFLRIKLGVDMSPTAVKRRVSICLSH